MKIVIAKAIKSFIGFSINRKPMKFSFSPMKHATVMNASNLLERYRMALWFCIEIACDDLCLLGYIRTLNLFYNEMIHFK